VKTGEWGGGLRRPPDVAMVQATNFGNLHDLPDLGSLDWPPIRRIFLEGIPFPAMETSQPSGARAKNERSESVQGS